MGIYHCVYKCDFFFFFLRDVVSLWWNRQNETEMRTDFRGILKVSSIK